MGAITIAAAPGSVSSLCTTPAVAIFAEGREPLLPGPVGPEGRERLAWRPLMISDRVPSLHYLATSKMLVMIGILLMTVSWELAKVLGVGRAIRPDRKASIGQSRHVLLVLVGRFRHGCRRFR